MEKGFPIKYEDFINRLGQISLIIKHSRRISPVEKQILYHRIAELEARSEVYRDNYKKINIISNIKYKKLSVTSKSLKAPLKIEETINGYGGGGDPDPDQEYLEWFAKTHPNGSYPYEHDYNRYITVFDGVAYLRPCIYLYRPRGNSGKVDYNLIKRLCPGRFSIPEVVIHSHRSYSPTITVHWNPFHPINYHTGFQNPKNNHNGGNGGGGSGGGESGVNHKTPDPPKSHQNFQSHRRRRKSPATR